MTNRISKHRLYKISETDYRIAHPPFHHKRSHCSEYTEKATEEVTFEWVSTYLNKFIRQQGLERCGGPAFQPDNRNFKALKARPRRF